MRDFLSIIYAWVGILLHTVPGQMALYLAIAALVVWGIFGGWGWWVEGDRVDSYTINLGNKQNVILVKGE